MNIAAATLRIPPAKHNAITALARIYLEAGLPLSAAFEAASADYAGFEEEGETEQSLCSA